MKGDEAVPAVARTPAAADPGRPRAGMTLAILLVFFVSGAAGLVYEVVWSRQLVLVFGNTTQAVSAILTGFFGGMAIGSVLGGRAADRVRSPLRLYAALELCLAVVALLTPVMFRLLHEAYRAGFTSLEQTPLALALLALGPATILMGATLPTLSRFLARRHDDLGGAFGRLYAVNTLGAIAGTMLAGFVLIEILGLSGTLAVGAACSATAGAAAFLLAVRREAASSRSAGPGRATAAVPAGSSDVTEDERAAEPRDGVLALVAEGAEGGGVGGLLLPRPAQPAAAPAGSPEPRRSAARESAPVESHRRLAIAVAFVSGLTSLGYQTLWTRLLSSGTGNMTYVFTAILTIFLVGITIGAAVYAATASRWRRPVAALGILQLAVAAIVIAGLGLVTGAIASPGFVQQSLVAVLPATLVMGLTFPLSSSLVADSDERVGTSAGLLLGANTFGAIVGTFVVPFVLVPAIGSPRSVVLLALLNAAVGVALVLRATGIGVAARAVLTGGGGVVAAVGLAGLLVAMPLTNDPNVNWMARHHVTLLASAEDEIASVQAGSIQGTPRIWVAGTSMTALTVDARLMSILPVMLRPRSQSMLVIAFGMGSSYREGLRAGLRVQGVELVPSVPGMFGNFYPDASSILADPNGRLTIADGRNHVELTNDTYDVVVVDPPPPIRSSGTAVLYSREFYAASHARLTPGGVMMEWMPYDQTVDEFRAHARTFASVFPHTLFAFGPGGYGIFMFGSDAPLAFDPQSVREVLARPNLTGDLSSASDSPVHDAAAWERKILSLPWISDAQVVRFGGDGPLITDDRPLTEYFLLRSMFGPKSPPMTSANLVAATPR